MEILASQNDWTAIDAENLAKFLETPTGRRVIPHLLDTEPQLLEAGDTNAILIRSGEARAYRKMIEALLGLAHASSIVPPSAGIQTGLPDLTDDAAWQDGQRLNDSKATFESTFPQASETPIETAKE